MKLPSLYKLSTDGVRLNQWCIEIEGNKFRTISGFKDMVQTTSEWTECSAKSYCSAEEQALKEATALHRKRTEKGYFEDITQVSTKIYFEPMLAKDYNDEKKKLTFPIASSIKLDGVRCIINKEGMWSRQGKKLISSPHIYEGIKHIFEENPNLILDGELFTNKEGIDFNKIISCVRKTKPLPEDLIESEKHIQYWCYDLIDGNNEPYYKRVENLKTLIEKINFPQLIYVGYELVHNIEEIENKLIEYVGKGYEGQILRVLNSAYENKRSKSLLKNKEFIDEEFIILSVNEGIGKYSNKAATMTFKSEEGVEFQATINGNMEYLEEIWFQKDELIGKQATVKHFGKTPDFSYRFPKVVQIDRSSYE